MRLIREYSSPFFVDVTWILNPGLKEWKRIHHPALTALTVHSISDFIPDTEIGLSVAKYDMVCSL